MKEMILLLTTAALISAIPCHAEVVYVDSTASGANNGSTWSDAHNYLQDALAGAAYGDEIWVAQGTYTPDANSLIPNGSGGRRATFLLENGVALYGGFATGGSTWDDRDPNIYECTLSGDLNGDDVVLTGEDDPMTDPSRSDNSIHVVIGSYTDPNTIIDGFTITAGLAGPDGGGADDDGGGMYIYAGEPSISKCNFTGNNARRYGGGIYIESADLDISDCSFIGNYAGNGGGAIATRSNPNNMKATRCNFTGNHAGFGGAIYNRRSRYDNGPYGSLIAADCRFVNNTAGYSGGGVNCDSVALTNCTFNGNSASKSGWRLGGGGDGGGGVYTKDARLSDCVFVANSAHHGGGMSFYSRIDNTPDIVRTMELANCTFRDNQAWGRGGGLNIHTIKYQAATPSVLTDCVFIGNSTNPVWEEGFGGGMYQQYGTATLTNCIFSENSAEGYASYNHTLGASGGGLYASGTLIDCVFTRNFVTSRDACEGGALSTSNSTLTDCLFRDNFAKVKDGYSVPARGGAVYSQGDTSVTNCTFTGNWVTQVSSGYDIGGGGAIYNEDYYEARYPTISNSSFVGNSVYGSGGGGGAIFNDSSYATIINCEFTENLAENEGGAIYNSSYSYHVISNCSFTKNSVVGEYVAGGAISDTSNCDTVITGCEFIGNTAIGNVARGGAACYVDTMKDCIFTGNSTIGRLSYGGAIYQFLSRDQGYTNCLFSGNYAKGELARGGAIYIGDRHAPLMNCTFVGNSAHGSEEGYGGGIYADDRDGAFTSCIFVDNTDDTGAGQSAQFYLRYQDQTPTNINYSCIQGWDGLWGGVGNSGDSPRFVDSGYWDPNETPDDVSDDMWIEGDYRLGAGSPCIDTGDPDYVGEPNEMDLGGNPRVLNGRVDMGVYEYSVSNTAPVADAGDDFTAFAGVNGAVVVLDGSASFDADGDELGYFWTWAVGEDVFDANGIRPVVELPVGEHVIELVVNDGVEESEPNSVLVTVIAPVEAKMFFVPRVINRTSRGKFVMAMMYLPEGVEKGDIVGGSFGLYVNGGGSGPIAAVMHRVIGSGNVGRVLVMFDRADVVDALSVDDLAVRVDLVANLEDGRCIVGSDTVRVVRPKRRVSRKPTRSTRSRRSGR